MGTIRKMEHQDEKRSKQGEAPTHRNELILAHEEESRVHKLEIEMITANETPFPRFGKRRENPPPKPHTPMAERLKFQGDIKRAHGCLKCQ